MNAANEPSAVNGDEAFESLSTFWDVVLGLRGCLRGFDPFFFMLCGSGNIRDSGLGGVL